MVTMYTFCSSERFWSRLKTRRERLSGSGLPAGSSAGIAGEGAEMVSEICSGEAGTNSPLEITSEDETGTGSLQWLSELFVIFEEVNLAHQINTGTSI